MKKSKQIVLAELRETGNRSLAKRIKSTKIIKAGKVNVSFLVWPFGGKPISVKDLNDIPKILSFNDIANGLSVKDIINGKEKTTVYVLVDGNRSGNLDLYEILLALYPKEMK